MMRHAFGENGSMADLSYRVILEPAEEGGFLVRIPSFPHIHTEGDNREDALRMAQDAIELELSYFREHDLPFPASDREDAIDVRIVVHTPAA
jgi:antitoxin HicB